MPLFYRTQAAAATLGHEPLPLQKTEHLATRAAAKSLLRRLRGYPPNFRFLRRWEFHDGLGYYRLTPLGCRTIGVDKHLSRELGPPARVESYALLWFS